MFTRSLEPLNCTMLHVPEYDLNNPVILTESDVISAGELQWFKRGLERIAGKNPFGKNVLEVRWGPIFKDEMSIDADTIKYLDFCKNGQQYGERRFILEIWRSPEFLERSGRYKVISDSDTVTERYFCKACETEIVTAPDALEYWGAVPPCGNCGSVRSRTELIREAGAGQLLQEFPRQGCYDYWLRLERMNLTYHPPDDEALQVVRALWAWEQMPQNKRDELEQADRELERRAAILAQRQHSGNAPQFGSGLITSLHNIPIVSGRRQNGNASEIRNSG